MRTFVLLLCGAGYAIFVALLSSVLEGSVIRFAPCPGILIGWTRRALIWKDYAKDCRTQTARGPHLVRQFPYRPRRHVDPAVAPACAPRRAGRPPSRPARRARQLSRPTPNDRPRLGPHAVHVPRRRQLSSPRAHHLWADPRPLCAQAAEWQCRTALADSHALPTGDADRAGSSAVSVSAGPLDP